MNHEHSELISIILKNTELYSESELNKMSKDELIKTKQSLLLELKYKLKKERLTKN